MNFLTKKLDFIVFIFDIFHMYKNYYCEIMRPPSSEALTAGAPFAPWLIRHWSRGHYSLHFTYKVCFITVYGTQVVPKGKPNLS